MSTIFGTAPKMPKLDQLDQLKQLKSVLRNRTVLLVIGATVVVLLVWLLAFFLPQGRQLSKYAAERTQLQGEQARLEAQLQVLQATSKATPELLMLQAKYGSMVPATPDMYAYISQMAATATQAGVGLTSMTPSSTGAAVTGTTLLAYPVTVAVTGTYDNTLGFLKALYAMPRLTVVNGITISGGGPGTNRGSPLNTTFTLTVYSAPQPAAAPAGAQG